MSTDIMRPCCGPNGLDTRPTSRREFLRRAGGGFGMLALTSLLGRDGLLASEAAAQHASAVTNPLASRAPHFPARVRNVIFLFMSGGPSHVDLFDPKPELIRLAGQPIPESFGTFKTRRNVAKNKLLSPLRSTMPRMIPDAAATMVAPSPPPRSTRLTEIGRAHV